MARNILDVVAEDMEAAAPAPAPGQPPVATTLEESAALLAPYAEQGLLANLGWNKALNNVYQDVVVGGEDPTRTERVLVDIDPAFKKFLVDNNISAARGAGPEALTITAFKDGKQVFEKTEPRGRDLLGEYLGIVGGVAGGAVASAIAPTIASSLQVSSQVANVIANAAVQATSQLAATGNIDPTSLALQAVSTVVSPLVGREVATQVNDAYQSLTGQNLSREVQNAVANAAGSAAGTAIKGGETSDVLQNTVAGAVASGLRDAGVNPGISRTIGMYISTGNVATAVISGVAREVASSSTESGGGGGGGDRKAASADSTAASAGRTELTQTETLPDGRTIEVESDGNIRVVDAQGFEKLIGTTADLAAGQSLADFAQQKLADLTTAAAAGVAQAEPTGTQVVETTGNRFTLPDNTEITVQDDGTISAIRENKQVLLGNVADVPAGSTVQQFAQQQVDVKLPSEAPAAAPAPAQQVSVTAPFAAEDQQILDIIAEERATPSTLISAPQEKANAAVQQVSVTAPAGVATTPAQIIDVVAPLGEELRPLEPSIPPPSPQQVEVTSERLPQDVVDILDITGIDYGGTPQRVEVIAPPPPRSIVDTFVPAEPVPQVEVTQKRADEIVDTTVPQVEVTKKRPDEIVDTTSTVPQVEVVAKTPTEIVDTIPQVEVTAPKLPKDVVDETKRVTVTAKEAEGELLEDRRDTETPLELYTTPRPKRPPPSTLTRTLQAPSFQTGITQGLGAARAAGEIESEVTGKRRRNVWNEASLRLKDALGI